MGYRSNVAFAALAPNGVVSQILTTAKLQGELPEALLAELKFKRDGNNTYVLFQNEGVKRYESYSDVVQYVNFFDKFFTLALEDENVHCAFARVGEDTGDVETRAENEGSYLLHIYSSISVNTPDDFGAFGVVPDLS